MTELPKTTDEPKIGDVVGFVTYDPETGAVISTESGYLVTQALADPQPWDEGGKVHNWRNYVTDDVRAIWHTFNPEQKVALARMADTFAGREEWE